MSQETGLPESFEDFEHVDCGGRVQFETDLVLQERVPFCIRCDKFIDRADVRVVLYDRRP